MDKEKIKSMIDGVIIDDIKFLDDKIYIVTNLNIHDDLDDSAINSVTKRIYKNTDDLYGMWVSKDLDIEWSSGYDSDMYISYYKNPDNIGSYALFYGSYIGGNITNLTDLLSQLNSRDKIRKDKFVDIIWDELGHTEYTRDEFFDIVELPDRLKEDSQKNSKNSERSEFI